MKTIAFLLLILFLLIIYALASIPKYIEDQKLEDKEQEEFLENWRKEHTNA